jgi:hypothetical protein
MTVTALIAAFGRVSGRLRRKPRAETTADFEWRGDLPALADWRSLDSASAVQVAQQFTGQPRRRGEGTRQAAQPGTEAETTVIRPLSAGELSPSCTGGFAPSRRGREPSLAGPQGGPAGRGGPVAPAGCTLIGQAPMRHSRVPVAVKEGRAASETTSSAAGLGHSIGWS